MAIFCPVAVGRKALSEFPPYTVGSSFANLTTEEAFMQQVSSWLLP